MKDFLMGGAVCLRRNYADLPFSPDSRADVAQAVNERVLPVLEKEEDTFTYLMVQQMEPEQRRVLIAHGLLDPDSADKISFRDNPGYVMDYSGENVVLKPDTGAAHRRL